MYIYQFAFFRQAQTEITKAATNFKKSAGKFAYAQPLFNNHDFTISILKSCVLFAQSQIAFDVLFAADQNSQQRSYEVQPNLQFKGQNGQQILALEIHLNSKIVHTCTIITTL